MSVARDHPQITVKKRSDTVGIVSVTESTTQERLFTETLGSSNAAKEFMIADDIIGRIRYRVRDYLNSRADYLRLSGFLVVVIVYFVILLMQRDPSTSYSIESTLKNFLYTTDSGTANVCTV